jgi:NADH-quinone oxidoreductase subunit E
MSPQSTVVDEKKPVMRRFARVHDIIEQHGAERGNLIAILQDIQAEFRYLPQEVLTYVATVMNLSPAAVDGVATFYAQFSMEPKGKHIVRVCDGTACHVRGSADLKTFLRDHFALAPNQTTTEDLQFTLETVACVGACALAPAVVIDDVVYGQQTPESLAAILDEISKQGV